MIREYIQQDIEELLWNFFGLYFEIKILYENCILLTEMFEPWYSATYILSYEYTPKIYNMTNKIKLTRKYSTLMLKQFCSSNEGQSRQYIENSRGAFINLSNI